MKINLENLDKILEILNEGKKSQPINGYMIAQLAQEYEFYLRYAFVEKISWESFLNLNNKKNYENYEIEGCHHLYDLKLKSYYGHQLSEFEVFFFIKRIEKLKQNLSKININVNKKVA